MNICKKCNSMINFGNSLIFSIGGCVKKKPLACCEKYDIFTNKWSNIFQLNQPISWPAVISYEKFIYAITGCSNSDNCQFERYNPIENQPWEIIKLLNSCEDLLNSACPKACVKSQNENVIIFAENKVWKVNIEKKYCENSLIKGLNIHVNQTNAILLYFFCKKYKSIL